MRKNIIASRLSEQNNIASYFLSLFSQLWNRNIIVGFM